MQGMKFDLNDKGEWATYTKEAAHSRNKNLTHADGDATGRMVHIFTRTITNMRLFTQTVCFVIY